LKVYVSFNDWKHIPREKFDSIDEWHADEERKYLVGLLPFSELKNNSWWKENNVSLIMYPDPVVEDIDTRKLKKRSLELAGII
jgi:homoserine dehydrogenase